MRGRNPSFVWAMVLVLLATAAVLLGQVCAADAQDRPELPAPEVLEAQCAPEVEAGRRATLAVAGVEGLWLHGDVARCMLARYVLLVPFSRYVRLLEQRMQLVDERDALRLRQVGLAAQEAQLARDALEAAIRDAREARADRDAWFRHPALWAAVGVVLAGALVAVGAYALAAVSP